MAARSEPALRKTAVTKKAEPKPIDRAALTKKEGFLEVCTDAKGNRVFRFVSHYDLRDTSPDAGFGQLAIPRDWKCLATYSVRASGELTLLGGLNR